MGEKWRARPQAELGSEERGWKGLRMDLVGGGGEEWRDGEHKAACRSRERRARLLAGRVRAGEGRAPGRGSEAWDSTVSVLEGGVVVNGEVMESEGCSSSAVSHVQYIVSCHLPAARRVVTSACRIRQSPLTWAMTSPHSRCHFLL